MDYNPNQEIVKFLGQKKNKKFMHSSLRFQVKLDETSILYDYILNIQTSQAPFHHS